MPRGLAKATAASDCDQAGFALALALLALLLLTFLALTLAATTSIELQAATNYRWSQQAFYNAEGGLEVAKVALKTISWGTVLPPARATSWPTDLASPAPAPFAPFERATRNWENHECDSFGNGIGYGVVLDDGYAASEPYEGRSQLLEQHLAGAVTLWIRRPVITDAGVRWDAPSSDRLILTVEGTAPSAYAGGAIPVNASVRVLEATLERSYLGPDWDVAVRELKLGSAVCH